MRLSPASGRADKRCMTRVAPDPEPNSLRRFLIGGAALATLLLLAGVWRFLGSIEQAERELAVSVREATADWRAQSWQRPVLHGDPVEGDATVYYRQAADLAERAKLEDLRQSWAAALSAKRSDATADQDAELLAAAGPAVAAMRQGARCARCVPGTEYERGFSARIANLLSARAVANAAVAVARREARDGDPLEAARVLLDTAAYGRDLGASGLMIERMISCALVAIAVWEPLRQDSLHPELRDLLDHAAARELLQQGLARLDEQMFTSRPEISGETVILGNGLLRSVQDPSVPRLVENRWGLWRFGGSLALVGRDAWREHCRKDRLLAAAARLDWPHRQAETDRLMASYVGAPNPVVARGMPNLLSFETNLTEQVALLRVVREAIAWRHTGSPAGLPDPFAPDFAALRTDTLPDGRRVVWSVGPMGEGRAAKRPLELLLDPLPPATPDGR